MFAGAVRLNGGPPPLSFRVALRAAPYCRDHPLHWVTTDGLIAVVGPEHGASPPAIVRSGPVTAVGVARVDNRAEMLKLLGDADPGIGDLALAGQVALRRGTSGVARLLGDFAFVVWEADTRTLIAARDTFGVKQLYYATPAPGVVTFSSRAELLAQGDDYNIEYLAAWVSYCGVRSGQTAFRGVAALPAASVIRWRDVVPVISRYWNAFDAQANGEALGTESEQCDRFRTLLLDAVKRRIPENSLTWSYLSGGLDSSSVVSSAEWMAEQKGDLGLAGTITFTDPIGSAADERSYSDAVVARFGLRNVTIPYQFDRSDLLSDLPRYDQPGYAAFSVAARDRCVLDTLQRARASVMLTGMGGDNLVLGTMFFFADWIATGQVWRAVREMARRSAIGRVSFWELAFQNAVIPLLPRVVRERLMTRPEATIPSWIESGVVRRYDLQASAGTQPVYGARPGHAFAHAQAAMVDSIPALLDDGLAGDIVDFRHPYLDRPLAELALRLAPEICVRPHAHKWILREAMRGLLPEAVRARVGKGSGSGLTAWSLAHEHALTDSLFQRSVLADLGLISVPQMRAAMQSTSKGGDHEGSVSARVLATLDVELWLQLRTGRWAPAAVSEHYTKTGKRLDSRFAVHTT
jgi:asparagine synthase (glutamine-hydrolysing)